MQDVVERHHLLRRMTTVARLRAQPLQPADDALVELRVAAHRVIDLFVILEQARQDFIDVGDRKGIPGAVLLDGARRTCAPPVPGLAQRVPVPHEEHVLRVLAAGDEHRDRLRLAESGQIEEVAVLPVGVLDVVVAVPHRRRGHDRDAVLAHDAHELAPAARELLALQSFESGHAIAGSP